MNKNREIERKFLVSPENFPDLSKMNYMDMTQGYIPNFNSDFIYRLRQIINMNYKQEKLNIKYFQAIKGRGDKDRSEFEKEISEEFFEFYWPLCDRNTVHKFRYLIPEVGSITVHLDIYKNQFKGLYVVEVEFDTIEKCDTFQPLPWFGREVTKERKYKNAVMAFEGIPKLLV